MGHLFQLYPYVENGVKRSHNSHSFQKHRLGAESCEQVWKVVGTKLKLHLTIKSKPSILL